MRAVARRARRCRCVVVPQTRAACTAWGRCFESSTSTAVPTGGWRRGDGVRRVRDVVARAVAANRGRGQKNTHLDFDAPCAQHASLRTRDTSARTATSWRGGTRGEARGWRRRVGGIVARAHAVDQASVRKMRPLAFDARGAQHVRGRTRDTSERTRTSWRGGASTGVGGRWRRASAAWRRRRRRAHAMSRSYAPVYNPLRNRAR